MATWQVDGVTDPATASLDVTLADAIVIAAFLAILIALYQVATTSGFNVFTANWPLIGENMVNVAFTTAIASMARDFISTTDGSVLNITPSTTTTPVPND